MLQKINEFIQVLTVLNHKNILYAIKTNHHFSNLSFSILQMPTQKIFQTLL